MRDATARCKFCLGPVPDDSPLSLCREHLQKAWDFWNETVARKVYDQRLEQVQRRDEEAQKRLEVVLEQARVASLERDAEDARHRAEIQAVALAAQEVEQALDVITEITSGASVVYYIKFGDRIKIGFSGSLKRRLSVLPHDEVLATEPGGRAVEAMRHRQFAADRITGEWFATSPSLLEHVSRLRAPKRQLEAQRRELLETQRALIEKHRTAIRELSERSAPTSEELLRLSIPAEQPTFPENDWYHKTMRL